MKKLATLLALWFALCATGAESEDAAPADGQAESANGETQNQAQEENQDADDEDVDAEGDVDADENRAAKPTEEVFTPSEDISEDLAVPFPVDI